MMAPVKQKKAETYRGDERHLFSTFPEAKPGCSFGTGDPRLFTTKRHQANRLKSISEFKNFMARARAERCSSLGDERMSRVIRVYCFSDRANGSNPDSETI